MAGIYLHIPFCKQACRYCDFFFSVSVRYKTQFVDCLLDEIRLRKQEGVDNQAETLYLGGGTPSLLNGEELDRILDVLHRQYTFGNDAEWTIECNPDDLDRDYLEGLRKRGFNRISIGIQSFREEDLKLMRRSHTAEQGEMAVLEAARAGFENITMDLIYGIPGQTLRHWEESVSKALSLPLSHLSAYHLTFEPGTVFDHWRIKNRLSPVSEETSEQMYRLLRDQLEQEGFDHYEISNFARNGNISEHNMIYWTGNPYTGYGPSAHSYDGTLRSWNISSLKGYMDGIARDEPVKEVERPNLTEKYHDYLITSLRTRWGADPDYIREQFGQEIHACFEKGAERYLREGTMWLQEGKVAITPGKWLITDHILRELFTTGSSKYEF
ncbi:MAG TPA: radical SAM family heme chaperone HemW [Bacteroides sp.]|nr:radical SAM family heme chaperone HemW [Bacteroides sp.]